MKKTIATASLVMSALLASWGAFLDAQAARTFAQPEEAVSALVAAVKAGKLEDVIAIFGAGSQELIDSSDPATARQNRQVFTIAAAEKWTLVDDPQGRKVLVIGNEEWPFPVPLVKAGNAWHFDTAAGKEEVLDRRIGRNELSVIETCRAYVTAQKRYAERGHDGKPAGVYAAIFASNPGKEDGLYWPTKHGEPRSPLGDLVAQSAIEGRPVTNAPTQPAPFHGYYFRILTGQGANAPGGAHSYIVNGNMSAGFALIAWPAQYDATGIMTFLVSADGVVHEKDLGTNTDSVARGITVFNPDKSWHPSE